MSSFTFPLDPISPKPGHLLLHTLIIPTTFPIPTLPTLPTTSPTLRVLHPVTPSRLHLLVLTHTSTQRNIDSRRRREPKTPSQLDKIEFLDIKD
jgi:hypothetical protein